MRVLGALRGASASITNSVINLLAIILASAAFAACSTDEPEEITPPRLVPVPITITTEKPEFFGGTPPADSRAIDWEAINNLDILVFNGETRVYRRYFTSSELGQGMTLDVPEGTGLVAYAFANVANDVFAGITTLTDLKNKTCTIPAWDTMDSWNDIPMSGRSDPFTVSLGQSTTGPSISFVLRRIAARLNITLTEGTGVTFKTMKLVNLPNKTYYVSRPLSTERSLTDATDDSGRIGGKDAVVPATPTDWIDESATLSSKSVSLYMFENRPGVTGNTNQAAKGKANAPDTRCTHLVITGEDSNNTYEWTFYLGSDATSNYNIKRNSVYTITATLKNSSVSDVRVKAESKAPINLSANGKANCYIINEAGKKYSFDATTRGNGLLAQGNVSASIGKSSDYEAVVLWSMNGSTSGNSATSVVKDVSYDSNTGVISFTSVKGSGANAVIALRNKSGSKAILWSWHIWAYTGAGTTHLYTSAYYSGKTSIKMMAHNLGVTNTAASAGTHAYQDGLLYQWGRKDPFMGGKNYTDATNPVKGTDFYSAESPTFVYTGTSGTPALEYTNPMTYYTSSDINTNYDRYTTPYDNLWGNSGASATWSAGGSLNPDYGTKSMFDPCPPGWKVPPRGTWARYFGTQEATSSSMYTPNKNSDFNKGFSFYYTAVGSGSTAWYAASGHRANTGALRAVGTIGYAWSASPGGKDSRYGGCLYFLSSDVSPLLNSYRSNGFSVRCAQE